MGVGRGEETKKGELCSPEKRTRLTTQHGFYERGQRVRVKGKRSSWKKKRGGVMRNKGGGLKKRGTGIQRKRG